MSDALTRARSLVGTYWLHRADQRVRTIVALNDSGGFVMSVPEQIDPVETVSDLAALEADWERVRWMPGWFTDAEAANVRDGRSKPAPERRADARAAIGPGPRNPGSWEWRRRGNGLFLVDGVEWVMLSIELRDDWKPSLSSGDMALIAAAPEMEALLRWFVERVGDIRPAHPNVAKAIAMLARIDAAKAG